MNELAVVRVRGTIALKPGIRETLKLLRLEHVNNCVLVPEDPHYTGMLKKSKDYITWGNVSKDSIKHLLEKRGRVTGNKKLTTETLKETKFKTVDALAESLSKGSVKVTEVEGLKPVFKLRPPKGGYERGGIKKSIVKGGALGYRKDGMDKILSKMI